MADDRFIKLTLEGVQGKPYPKTQAQTKEVLNAYNALVTASINTQKAYFAMLREGNLTDEKRKLAAAMMENMGRFVKPFVEAIEGGK